MHLMEDIVQRNQTVAKHEKILMKTLVMNYLSYVENLWQIQQEEIGEHEFLTQV